MIKRSLCVPLCTLFLLSACGDDTPGTSADGTGTETAETGDESGSAEGMSMSQGDGDGDPGDGDGDSMACADAEPDMCGDLCTDLQSDELNCGECELACADGQSCREGVCVRGRVMFVTQGAYAGNLGGLLGADALCDALAAQHLPAQKQFWAWNSSEFQSPNSTFQKDGFFIRTDGVEIAADWVELTSGQLQNPIDHDESGALIPFAEACNHAAQVWTGTSASGDKMGTNCFNWTTDIQFYNGSYGNLHATDPTWSMMPLGTCVEPATSCAIGRHIYCLET